MSACKLERFRWTDYQIFLCINTLVTSDRDEALLAEKLTQIYNAHCDANKAMSLATLQTEVKKFWRDKKETKDLMYKGGQKPGLGGGNGRKERQRRNRKNKSDKEEFVNQVKSGEEKSKDTYCNRCGDTAHLVGDCPNKGDLKCKGHPNSNSHTDLACYYYRKSQ